LDGKSTVYWHMNFGSQTRVFHSYHTTRANPEDIQVLEHPALASMREMLTVTESPHHDTYIPDQGSSPILLRGVPRAVQLQMSQPDTFKTASPDAIHAATQVCRPNVKSNIVAVSYPDNLYEELTTNGYTLEVIVTGLRILFSAYMAVRKESLVEVTQRYEKALAQESDSAASATQSPGPQKKRMRGSGKGVQACSRPTFDDVQIVVSTDNPGSSADSRAVTERRSKVLTALLHLIAANMTGIDTLLFHSDMQSLDLAIAAFDQICTSKTPLVSLLVRIHDIAAHWN
jgi:hypothetical protein